MYRTLPANETTFGYFLEVMLMGGVLGLCFALLGTWEGLLVGFLVYSGARALLRYVPILRKAWHGITRSYPRTFDDAVSCYLLPVLGPTAPLDTPYEMVELTQRQALSVFTQYRVGTTEPFDSQLMFELIERLKEPRLVELPPDRKLSPMFPVLAVHILDAPVYRTLGGQGMRLSEARIRYCLYKKQSGDQTEQSPVPEPDIIDVVV